GSAPMPALRRATLTAPGDLFEQDAERVAHAALARPDARPIAPGERADFSGIRVHTDARAAASARAVSAEAYTVGEHVVFGAGKFAPTTRAGRSLLAHELAHTIQQQCDSAGRPVVPRRWDAADHECDAEPSDKWIR